MSLSRRLRNIAKSQVNALKERLDRIDEEAEVDDLSQRAERDAAKELDDPTDIRPARRSPEEIAAGTRVKAPTAAPPLRRWEPGWSMTTRCIRKIRACARDVARRSP